MKGKTASFTATWASFLVNQLEAGEAFAGHDAGGDLGHGNADDLGHEGHGARGAGVYFEDVDQIILDGELDVHQAHDIERQRHFFGLRFHLGDDGGFQGIGRERTGAVAGVDARFFDVFHDAGDEHVLAIANGIDVHFDGVGEVAVDQHRAVAGDDHGLGDVALELGIVADDFHGAAAQHIGGADDHGEADFLGDLFGFGGGTGDAVFGLAQFQFLEKLGEAVTVFGEDRWHRAWCREWERRVLRVWRRASSGVWPPNWTMTPFRVPLDCST